MLYQLSLYMLLFGIYSFAGWCIEVVVTAMRERHFVNRGVMNGPMQPIYGVMALLAGTLLEPQQNSLITMLIASTVLCIVVELVTGAVLEHVFHLRWWDYSNYKRNLMGLVALWPSLLKGVIVALCAKYLHPLLLHLLCILPSIAVEIAALAVLILLGMDTAVSLVTLGMMRHSWKSCGTVAAALRETSTNIGSNLARRAAETSRRHQQRHLSRAFPNLVQLAQSGEEPEPKPKVFAAGLGFYKLFWLFFIGALVGDLVEMVYVRCTSGIWMSRSSLLYGPFSLVWGIGCMLISMVLQGFADKNDRYVFVGGALLGGVYEYMCSVVTELFFGKVFWDYSDIPLNINGRINLLYCLFWGVVAVIWVKELYPRLSRLIERIPIRPGKILTWVLFLFLIGDVLISSMAMGRLDQREKGLPPQNAVEIFLDEQYPDDYMYRRYQNMFKTE